MADWTDDTALIASLAAGKAYTDEKAQAQVENPVAIAEGATGAPRIHPAALDTYRGRVSLSGTTGVQYLNLDRFKVVSVDAVLFSAAASGSTVLQARYSNNNGATWGSYQSFTGLLPLNSLTSTSRRDVWASLYIDLTTGVASWRGVRTGTTASSEQAGIILASGLTHTVPADCNAIEFRYDAAGPTGTLDLRGLSGVAS